MDELGFEEQLESLEFPARDFDARLHRLEQLTCVMLAKLAHLEDMIDLSDANMAQLLNEIPKTEE